MKHTHDSLWVIQRVQKNISCWRKSLEASNSQIQDIRRSGRAIQQMDLAKTRAKVAEKESKKQMHGDDPIWSLPPDDPRLQYALHLETYPVEVRERLIPLGQEVCRSGPIHSTRERCRWRKHSEQLH